MYNVYLIGVEEMHVLLNINYILLYFKYIFIIVFDM